MMRFGSVSSGIEAASVAWHPLGWQAAWLAEIAPFPSALLAHHYPDVPNLGDMTTLPERILFEEVEAPDVLCGGTPCQAFSVAGLRRSLDDARGNLALVFCEIANAIDTIRAERGEDPCTVFWENVPGVLTTKDNAFGCILAGLAGEDEPLEPPGGKWTNAGYVLGPKRAVAWRVLDAQYFGVAQRRRRVFVVASAREGFDPAAVLFEFEGVRRDTPPSREAGEAAAGGAARSVALRSREGGGTIELGDDVGGCLRASSGGGDKPHVLAAQCVTGHIPHTLKAEGFDASEDGTGRGQPIVVHGTQDPCHDEHVAFTLGRNSGQENAIAFNPNQEGMSPSSEITPPIGASTGGGNQNCIAFSCKDHGGDAGPLSLTLRSMGHNGSHANAGGQVAVAFAQNSRDEVRLMNGDGQIVGALAAEPGMKQTCYVAQPAAAWSIMPQNSGRDYKARQVEVLQPLMASGPQHGNQGGDIIQTAMQVRRLTPRECERLQGFPDDYTLIPHGRRVKAEKLDQDFIKYQMRGNPKHLTRDDIDRLAADGPRYKALGNSWAVPNVRWIGERIDLAGFLERTRHP